ncbi:hypothetical protein VaNZ11_016547, partial [Volvox africanus]
MQCSTPATGIQGTVNGRTAVILIDGGATGSFVHTQWLARREVKAAKTVSNMSVKLPNGQEQDCPYVLPNASITIRTFKCRSTLVATDLGDFNVVLGKDWLAQWNPHVCWRSNTVTLRTPLTKHVLQGDPPEAVNVVHKVNTQDISTLGVDMTHINSQYADVFAEPTDMPPTRAVDHQIELTTSVPMSRNSYRMSQDELAE